MRLFALIVLAMCLVACAHAPMHSDTGSVQTTNTGENNGSNSVFNPCAPTRVHKDSDYTPGGLYAPGVADSGPTSQIDVSGLPEPVPHNEPRSLYGNKSPYTVLGKKYRVLDHAKGYVERGVASWYGNKFNGRATSSGETYEMCSFTAAHKTLPLPSYARVTNLDNGRSVVVRINDRGPFRSGRILDLSYAAAVRLGVDRTGTANVEVRAITSAADDPGTVSAEAYGASDSADSGRRIVQVGSFQEKSNAKRLAERLEDGDINDVDIDHTEVDGTDVWRVRIGPVKTSALPALIGKLRALGLSSPRVFSE